MISGGKVTCLPWAATYFILSEVCHLPEYDSSSNPSSPASDHASGNSSESEDYLMENSLTSSSRFPTECQTSSDNPTMNERDVSIIKLDMDSWRSTVSEKVLEYLSIPRTLSSQKYKVNCDYDSFKSVFADEKLYSVKYARKSFFPMPWLPLTISRRVEYIGGFAELTVYAASIIHNAIGELEGDDGFSFFLVTRICTITL